MFDEVDDARLTGALAGSSFENLQKREIERLEKRGKSSDRLFFNSGRSGQSISEALGVEIDDEFDAAFVEPQTRLQNAITSSSSVISAGTDL